MLVPKVCAKDCSEFLKGSKLTFGLKEGVICCATVRCCTKFMSSGAERTRWDSDGPNGPDTLPNSQSILLDWWTNGENYHLYRGGTDCDGKTSSREKKEKDEKRVSWKLKEMEESRKMKEAEMQETRKFKEAEHHLKEREVLAKETEVAVHKLKVEGELAKMQSEAELIQEQKKAVMQDRMKKLLMDRKELLELGISLEEVNLMLPLN
jgi:hypothetical protein